MQIRVADFVADFLVKNDITEMFSVVGGGAMYLNDAFGNAEGLHVTYNHHEQACAIAAESYARIKERAAAVCVTTGPGGTNALTGVLCAYQDSIPMIVISGQVRYNTTVESTGLNLRQFGEQEFSIVPAVSYMTKYAEMVRSAEDILYHLQRAIYIAHEGRRGPVWLDIPLDIQGAYVETDALREYEPEVSTEKDVDIKQIMKLINEAHRPVIFAGEAIRSSGAYSVFRKLVSEYKIPVLATATTLDLMALNEDYYYGNVGSFGGRAGNFIIQNADLILALGCRMSFKQIGFNYELFSPDSKKIVVDIDSEELKKKTVKIDYPINMDVGQFMNLLIKEEYIADIHVWIDYCNDMKERYPMYLDKFAESKLVNPYEFANKLNKRLPDDSVFILGNSVACVCVQQIGIGHANQRQYTNKNCGTMGYDIPAAIGASIAKNGEVICITGDGSFQMNLQELQTIVHNRLPIKMIIFNNGGYQAIMQTQTNFFGRLSGCNVECGLSMPDFERIAYAYDIPYVCIKRNSDIDAGLDKLFSQDGCAICELIQDLDQGIEPRSKSIQTESGKIISPPIDNLYPFLPEDEYEGNRFSEWLKKHDGNKETTR